MPRASKTATQAEETEQVVNSTEETEKQQETANTNATEESFIYIGPTTNTGLVENTIFTGSREKIEKYLESTIKKLPQIRLLIVPTENLAVTKPKVRTAGTLLNKYYNDVLSLMRKSKED